MSCRVDLGKAVITPDAPVTAGTHATIRFTYTAGHCIDDTGYVRISFRYAGDFGAPQFDRAEQANFCSVTTSGECRIEPRWDPKGNIRPWGKSLYLKVMGGFLDQGEEITVIFGDTSQGSPGWFAQTFAERTFEFKTYVDCFATYRFEELPESPVIRVLAGRPAALTCIAPSIVARNAPFTYFTRLQDSWGNIIEKAGEQTHPGYAEEGTYEIAVKDETTGLEAISNPILVVSEREPLRYWWGDLHGQSEETIGTNSIEDYFSYARDHSKMDVSAHQGNDFQITDEFWDTVNRTTARFYEPGAFVTFPGYEWSGNTPLGGDRNVYFREEGGAITRSHHDLLPDNRSKYPHSPTAHELFQRLGANGAPGSGARGRGAGANGVGVRAGRAKAAGGKGAFVFAHAGGRYANIAMHAEDIEVAMEVHSAWGTFEWLVADALNRGYRIGICAASDDHKCRPGASYPGAGKFGSLGGLTCFLAEKLDRDHIYEAIKSRHFYATTGNRPILSVRAECPSGRTGMMGDMIETDETEVALHVRVIGTGNIEQISLFNGTEQIESRCPYTERYLGRRIKVVWSGAEVRGRDRMVIQDGNLTIEGNRIRSITPINFWNPLKKVVQDRPG
jgi:hypothetical protein